MSRNHVPIGDVAEEAYEELFGTPLALISVADKTGIVQQAQRAVNLGYEIVSTGKTAKALAEAGIPVLTVAELRFRVFSAKMKSFGYRVKNKDGRTIPMRKFFEQMFPTEMLDHRVATLHAEVQGAILAADDMLRELLELGFRRIKMVIIDLYDLDGAVNTPGLSLREVCDKIDIGGVTGLRAAAKNLIAVASNNADRELMLSELEQTGDLSETTVKKLAANTFARMAQYDLLAARYLSDGTIDGVVVEKFEQLLYGENPNQKAWLAREFDSQHKQIDDELSALLFKHVQGMKLSFNNWVDLNRLLHSITHLKACYDNNGVYIDETYNAIGVKHGNQFGAGASKNRAEAIKRMLDGDLLAGNGGLMIADFTIRVEEAEVIMGYKMPAGQIRLLDAIFAPSFTDSAKEILQRKGENKLRLVENAALDNLRGDMMDKADRWLQLRGGAWLIQDAYSNTLDLVNGREYEAMFVPHLSTQDIIDACLAHTGSHTSNSNTIAVAKNGMMLACAVGQQDRVGAAWLARWRADRAGHDLNEAIWSGDSFNPKDDGFEVIADTNAKLYIATSGSLTGDGEVRKALMKRRREGRPYPGLIWFEDKKKRGFAHHSS